MERGRKGNTAKTTNRRGFFCPVTLWESRRQVTGAAAGLRSVPPLTARGSGSFLIFHHKQHPEYNFQSLTQASPEEVVSLGLTANRNRALEIPVFLLLHLPFFSPHAIMASRSPTAVTPLPKVAAPEEDAMSTTTAPQAVPFPPPQTFDIIPPLHNLLLRLLAPSNNVADASHHTGARGPPRGFVDRCWNVPVPVATAAVQYDRGWKCRRICCHGH